MPGRGHTVAPALGFLLRSAPAGEAPGFVVLMHQPSQPIALSVERRRVGPREEP